MNETLPLPGANGRSRPQLADSVERLEELLDGLAEAIPQTVADSVRSGLAAAVQQAVHDAVQEVLTGPEVAAALHASNTSNTSAQNEKSETEKVGDQRGCLGWLRSGWDAGVTWFGERLSVALDWCCGMLARLGRLIELGWQVRGALGIGVAAGTALGVLAYYLGPLAASILCGVAAAGLTAAGVLLVPIVRVLCRLNAAEE